jgi:hypothetical protein
VPKVDRSLRKITSFADAQIIINEMLNWRKRIEANWDRHGNQIKNAGSATDPKDFVTLDQLPQMPPPPPVVNHHYSIPFSTTGPATTGMQSAPYIVREGRTGAPIWVTLAATTAPTTGNLTANISRNGVNILTSDITLPSGQNGPVKVGNFTTPIPHFGLDDLIVPVVTNDGGSALITIQVGVLVDANVQ